MRVLISLVFLLTFGVSIGQVYNPTPQYVFKNKLGVGRSTAVDSAAYMNIGPNGGAIAGVVLPRVADTASITGTKRHGLLIFSNQLNSFAWYDSTAAVWTEVGSGSGTSSGEVMLLNGSSTIGDSLLISTVTGDTAYIKNILAGSGLLIEAMGDTVLKINVDSSTVPNIYNSDGTITGERQVNIDPAGALYFYDPTYSDWWMTMGYDGSNLGNRIELGPVSRTGGVAKSSIIMGSNLAIDDSTSSVRIESFNMIDGIGTNFNITLDSSGIKFNGMIKNELLSVSAAANYISTPMTGNYLLPDLTSTSASRTFRMIPRVESGYRMLIINENTDATYKWTFTGTTVIDKDGSTVTNIDDDSVYELLFDGTNWRIINKY